jgi:predicted metal-dependent hydrolase
VRSKRRKTLGLQVKHGQIIIRAPHFVDETYINTFIQKNQKWLKSKVSEQRNEKFNYFDFSCGSNLLFFGSKVKLAILLGQKNSVTLKEGTSEDKVRYLVVTLNKRKYSDDTIQIIQVKKQLEAFFKTQAQHYITRRINELSSETSLVPTRMKIRQYKSRWGSCNNRGEVSFNYLLTMTPTWVIDYVIIHELCHLEHLNHSKDFWLLVANNCPNYNDAKQWLTDHQKELVWRLPN